MVTALRQIPAPFATAVVATEDLEMEAFTIHFEAVRLLAVASDLPDLLDLLLLREVLVFVHIFGLFDFFCLFDLFVWF